MPSSRRHIRIAVPNPGRKPNRCNPEPFKPETPKIALYLVLAQGRLTLQVVCLRLAHFRLPVRPLRNPLPGRHAITPAGRAGGGGMGDGSSQTSRWRFTPPARQEDWITRARLAFRPANRKEPAYSPGRTVSGRNMTFSRPLFGKMLFSTAPNSFTFLLTLSRDAIMVLFNNTRCASHQNGEPERVIYLGRLG